MPGSYNPPATPTGDIAVTETLTGAVFTDSKGDEVTLSGTWTTYYNAATGAIDNNQNAYLEFTATGALGTTSFTKAYAPYSTPLISEQGSDDGYELTDNASSNNIYNSLYFDYLTQTPSSLTTALTAPYHSTIKDENGNDYTLTSGGSVTCFLAGTAIAVPGGAKPVEALRPGDMVALADGRSAPVRWVGHRILATRFADPLIAYPICIRAGALGDGLPLRDLFVSPAHAMMAGGVLVQAGALVNDISILRVRPQGESFTYYHIELEAHELLLAEGAAAESFIDHVEPVSFDNWAEREALLGSDAPMAEMDLPRAKSARQVPGLVLAKLRGVAERLYSARRAA